MVEVAPGTVMAMEQVWSIADIWAELLARSASRDCFAFAAVNKAAKNAFDTYLQELHPYKPGKVPFRAQRQLAKAVLEGQKYHLFAHPPGWGKTGAAAVLAVQCKRTVILAKPGLIQQIQTEFTSMLRHPDFGLYDGKKNFLPKNKIVFASIYLKWSNPKHQPLLGLDWELLVIDESRSLRLLPTAPFSKVVILNATVADKDLIDITGTKLDFTVHEDLRECEPIPDALQYRQTPVKVVEIHVSWSKEEAVADYEYNSKLPEHFNLGRRIVADMPRLSEVRRTWPLYANRMLERYMLILQRHHSNIFGQPYAFPAQNIVPKSRADWMIGGLLKATDRVLYFGNGAFDTEIGMTTHDFQAKTVGESVYKSIAAWKSSNQQWLTFNTTVGQLGFNIQEANVLVTWGYKQWKQRLGRLARRGQAQEITWYVFIERNQAHSSTETAPKALVDEVTEIKKITVADLPPPPETAEPTTL